MSPDTCKCLLDSQDIEAWKNDPHSTIWLYRLPGCGKAILCSAIVKDLASIYHADEPKLPLHHFFEFAARNSSTVSSFLRSMPTQTVVKQTRLITVFRSLLLKHSLLVSSDTKHGRVVEFSHATIREYLTSSRILSGKLQIFLLDLIRPRLTLLWCVLST